MADWHVDLGRVRVTVGQVGRHERVISTDGRGRDRALSACRAELTELRERLRVLERVESLLELDP